MPPSALPTFRWMRANPGGPRLLEPRHLAASMPQARHEQLAAQSVLTYETYLAAMESFIRMNWDQILRLLREKGCPKDLRGVDIVTEKHGQSYHPARVVFHCSDADYPLALFAALTQEAQIRLEAEFELLQRLKTRFRTDRIPEPHLLGEVEYPTATNGQQPMVMALAEWFEGYHEFHVSLDGPERSAQLVVWDLEWGYSWTPPHEAAEIFRQVAYILTSFYDVHTFEEVYPWHHAAGDFVVSRRSGRVDVKLTTVRQYAPRMVFEEDDSDAALNALLAFLANLTIRARLDRLDGIGDLHWADEPCLDATMQGFLDALREKGTHDAESAELVDRFLSAMKSMSVQDLAKLFRAVISSYDPDSPDVPVIMEHAADHVFQVYQRVCDPGSLLRTGPTVGPSRKDPF